MFSRLLLRASQPTRRQAFRTFSTNTEKATTSTTTPNTTTTPPPSEIIPEATTTTIETTPTSPQSTITSKFQPIKCDVQIPTPSCLDVQTISTTGLYKRQWYQQPHNIIFWGAMGCWWYYLYTGKTPAPIGFLRDIKGRAINYCTNCSSSLSTTTTPGLQSTLPHGFSRLSDEEREFFEKREKDLAEARRQTTQH